MAETKNPPVITVKQPYYTSDGTKLFLGTSTEVQRDANGKYIPGSAVTSLRLYDTTFSPLGTDYKTVAIREAGKPWTFTKDGNGNTVAGKDLQQTLANPNSLMNVNLNNHISNSMGAPLQGVPAGQRNPNTKQDVQQAVGINTNTAATPPNAGIGSATEPQFTQQEAISAIKSLNVRTSYKNLSYPERRSKEQDYIKFEMLEYSPRSFSGANLKAFEGGVDKGLGQKVFGDERLNGGKDRNAIGTVSLPISSPISDTNSVAWGEDSANALTTLGQSAFMNLVGGPTTQSNDDSKTPPGKSGSSDATKTMITSELAKKAVGGSGGNLLTRATGAIMNPNIELLFNGPSLRTFSFTFPLLARSKKESEIILQIIRFFKQGMSVKRSESALFLKSPHTFRIKYIYAENGKDHPWINRIKECALTNCSVNYTPAGNYATYANGAMTMYEITLNFSELEPIFDDDYASLDGNSAGKDTMVGY